MRFGILDRYLTRGIVLPTLSSVAVLCMVLVVGNLLMELLPLIIFQRLPILQAIGFMVTVIPFTLPFILPWSLLVGVQLTFGRLSADNELTMVSAAGVSLPRFCLPVFLIAIGFSFMCLWINCIWAPRAQVRMLDSIVSLALENPRYLFQNNLSPDLFPDRKVFVESVEGNLLKNIQIFELSKQQDLMRVITAKRATVSRAKEAGSFLLTFKDSRIEDRLLSQTEQPMKIRQGIYLKEGTYVLPVEKATGADQRKNTLTAQSMTRLQEEGRDHLNPRRSAAWLEIHRRLSLAMACMTFVLVGIPLAVSIKRRETTVGFGISLILAFYYYFFIVIAQAFSETPLVSIPLVWTPNVVFVVGGWILFKRLCKR